MKKIIITAAAILLTINFSMAAPVSKAKHQQKHAVKMVSESANRKQTQAITRFDNKVVVKKVEMAGGVSRPTKQKRWGSHTRSRRGK